MRDLSDYVEVHVRIAEFWKKHPDGAIHTEMEFPDQNTVRCKASVFRSAPDAIKVDHAEMMPIAIGHAEEKRDVGVVNKTSAVENCETSAVGRALALMGFSIHKGIASREEVEIAQRKAAAQKKPLPEKYVDWLRLAIRSRDKNELGDEVAWKREVDAATTPEQKKALVDRLEALALDLDLNVEAIRERWEANKVQAEAASA